MLVHRAPKVVQRAVDAEEDLIHVPGVARSWPPLAQLGRELCAEAEAPATDTLVADHYAPLGQDQLDVA